MVTFKKRKEKQVNDIDGFVFNDLLYRVYRHSNSTNEKDSAVHRRLEKSHRAIYDD